MKNVHFIVNPIAGKGDSTINEVLLSQYFEAKHFDLCLKISNYPGHATELTKASLHEGAHIIVACGGDGTINEVASCLVGTDIPLGIIPFGSGNRKINFYSLMTVIGTWDNKVTNKST